MNALLLLSSKITTTTKKTTLEAKDRQLFKAAEIIDRYTIEKEND